MIRDESYKRKPEYREKMRKIAIEKGFGKWMKDRKLPIETRMKMRERMLKNPLRYFLGKRLTPKHRKKISLGLQGKVRHTEKFRENQRQRMKKDNPMFKLENRQKVSESLMGKFKGKKNPSYIDGRSLRKGYQGWVQHRRKIKKKQAGGSHTFKEWEELKKKYNYTCPSCGEREPFKNQFTDSLTVDHVVPVECWNKWIKEHPEINYRCDDIENIQPLCFSCNSRKNNKIKRF